MYWQFSSDPGSKILDETLSGLLAKIDGNNNNNDNNNLKYPIKFTRVNRIASHENDAALLKSMAVPVNSSIPGYSHISFSSWTYRSGPQGSLLFWVSPDTFLTSAYQAGRTKGELRTALKQKYHKEGVKVLAHVFGYSQLPTTAGYRAEEVAINLARFVNAFALDGVDIDYQDSGAFRSGVAEAWLITFTLKLRQLLPKKIIVQTVNAAYFVGAPIFSKGGFLTVNQHAGTAIDFYNIRYFKQGNSVYNNWKTLFSVAGGWATGTSVNELVAKGVDRNKIVVAKTTTIGDGDPAAFVPAGQLSAIFEEEFKATGWKTGLMLYEFASDLDGRIIKQATKSLEMVQ